MRFAPCLHRSVSVDWLGAGWNDLQRIDRKVGRVEQMKLELGIGESIFERTDCSIECPFVVAIHRIRDQPQLDNGSSLSNQQYANRTVVLNLIGEAASHFEWVRVLRDGH